MPLQKFKDEGLLFNTNFLESTGESGLAGSRGELVLVAGEVADAKGHNKPPVEVMRGARGVGRGLNPVSRNHPCPQGSVNPVAKRGFQPCMSVSVML